MSIHWDLKRATTWCTHGHVSLCLELMKRSSQLPFFFLRGAVHSCEYLSPNYLSKAPYFCATTLKDCYDFSVKQAHMSEFSCLGWLAMTFWKIVEPSRSVMGLKEQNQLMVESLVRHMCLFSSRTSTLPGQCQARSCCYKLLIPEMDLLQPRCFVESVSPNKPSPSLSMVVPVRVFPSQWKVIFFRKLVIM